MTRIKALAVLLLAPLFASAQSARLDDGKFVSNRNQTVARLSCSGTAVQFARGLRWTPPDYGVLLSFSDSRATELAPGCYTEMACVRFRGRPSLLLTLAPACGGSAVPEEYMVFDLNSMKKTVLGYGQAKREGLISY